MGFRLGEVVILSHRLRWTPGSIHGVLEEYTWSPGILQVKSRCLCTYNISKWQELIDERCKNIPDHIDDINKIGYDQESLAEVKIVDKTYLTAKFKAKVEKEQNIIDSTVSDFLLNIDQERAFRIIANHASTKKPGQLIMYIGGMAGTGKSQVIKALTAFFEKWNESHRIVITAPTGTAAALVGGSTYHSILGINDKSASTISMAK